VTHEGVKLRFSTANRLGGNRNQNKTKKRRKAYKEAGTAEQIQSTRTKGTLTESTATMTTVTNNKTTTAQPTAHDGAERNISSRIQVLSKNGPHNKRFDSRAAQLTQELYAVHFGPPRVTKAAIRALNIQHVLWIEDVEGTPIAASAAGARPCAHAPAHDGREPDQGERGGAAGGSGHDQAVHRAAAAVVYAAGLYRGGPREERR
jgi:hypothetical protein